MIRLLYYIRRKNNCNKNIVILNYYGLFMLFYHYKCVFIITFYGIRFLFKDPL
jgi:hypothetical protein